MFQSKCLSSPSSPSRVCLNFIDDRSPERVDKRRYTPSTPTSGVFKCVVKKWNSNLAVFEDDFDPLTMLPDEEQPPALPPRYPKEIKSYTEVRIIAKTSSIGPHLTEQSRYLFVFKIDDNMEFMCGPRVKDMEAMF
uniref:Uncharacterized protein n=1 Tax=Strigamia maritima TaxID=126957 RepID=T1JE99_STRMM